LANADLRRANLYKADVTSAQLEQAESLEGAILPDGARHE
ncbi:MAG: pentapeptide repeat-containing protein, partial [Anaerolineae bacterium]|nr:pentapeptide repeat-containing protein [Anaerolineae bacterium]